MEERREGGDGGAGGKLTRRSFRTRTSSTPYDRPPLARKVDGWFSKLLLQPASKILPSLFAVRSQDPNLHPPPLSEPEYLSEPEREDCGAEPEREDCDAEPTLISDGRGASTKTGQPEADSKANELVGDKSGNIWDDNGLADIEQQLKQKNFSTDETNRLIELLRSRTIDLPEDDGHTARFTPEGPVTIPGRKNFRTRKEEYPVYKTSKTSDPFPFRAQDVGSSPIEIAKAYMGGQTLPSGYDCQSGRLKNESVFSSEKSILKLPLTPAAKSSTSRPGGVVQSDHGYFTPQRGRTGFGPRTPYTGTIFSNSKFQVNGERAESSSAVWKQSLTPMFGSTKKSSRRTNPDLDNAFSSGGPIRHVRPMNMMTNASTEASPSSQATSFPFFSKSSNASIAGGNPKPTSSKRTFCNVQSIDVDDEASKFPSDCLTVHPQSSKMAKKILEHLNRTIPSPKEKSSELKLAIERTRSPISSALLNDGHDDRSRTVISNSAEQKTRCLLGRDVVPQEGADAKKVLLRPSTSISKDKDGLPSLQTNNQAIFRQFQKATYTEASHSSHEAPIVAAKSESKRNSCDNGVNFTFPVSFTSEALDESPPTPTMTHSVAARKKLEATRESIPSFKFGSSTSDSRPVFSFSSSPDTLDTASPVFKFGSESKPALSFKPIGKDAFCC